MKKIALILLLLVSFGTTVFAGNITVNSVSSPNNQCNPNESEDVDYYIDGEDISRNPYDVFWNTLDSIISVNSEVDLWRNGVIGSCNDRGRVSNFTIANDPGGVSAITNVDDCVFDIPDSPKYNDANRLDAQIHYDIAYKKVWDGGPEQTTARYYYRNVGQNTWNCYPGGNTVNNYRDCNETTVNHGILNHHVGECLDYRIFWCGDGLVNGRDGDSDYTNGTFDSEQCDPADPTHEGWGNQGCSNTCEPINETIEAPTCTLGYTSIGNDQFLIYWNIVGSFYTPSSINITPNTLVQSSYSVLENQGQWVGVEPTEPGIYTANMTVTNQGGSNNCQTTFTLNAPDEAICGDGNIDTPNDDGFNEQCDDGNNVNTDGCKNDCTLNAPSCTLTVSPSVQNLGESVTFIGTKSPWAVYQFLEFDDGTMLNNSNNYPIYFPYDYVYNEVGSYDPVLTVRNDYSPIAAGVDRPTNICGTTVDVVQQMPELSLDKILLTTDPVGIGDFVDYKIELTNNGQGVSVDTYLKDEMPASLELISYNIVGISNFEVNDWQDINGNWFVEYSDFDLNPGQTVTMTLRGKVRDGALAGQTTNCAFTIGEVDCEMYSLSNNPYIIKYQKNANASSSTSTLSMDDILFVNEVENMVHNGAQPEDPQVDPNSYITGDIAVNFGDIIKYKIKFGNNGATYTNGGVRVVDHMPKCVDYVTASIQGVDDANFVQTQDAQGRWLLEYNGFDLEAGQQGYMLVEGQVMNTPECQNVDTYINNAYIYFANPLRVETSNTTAIRVNGEANVYKDSDVDVHMPGDDKTFNIWVSNNTPNPITDLILEDIWPVGSCIEYVDRSGNGFEKDPNSLTWTYEGPLPASSSAIMYIDAHILNDASCVNPDYVNVVNLTYTEAGSEKYDEAEYHFEVIGSPVANVSLNKTADKTVVSSGDDITYTIVYQNNGTVALDSYVLTDIWPAMVDFQTANPFPNSIMSFVTGDVLKWIFNTPLLPGEGGEIIIEGIVK